MKALLLLIIWSRGGDGQSIVENILDGYREAMELPPGMTRDAKSFSDEYDFVVVGAGSGGCVVTNRLTENPNWNVLLIEAGKEEILLTDVPLLVSYILGTGYNWGYRTERQPDICMGMDDSRCSWPRGKGMGGTSVINYMVYTRGFDEDYDEWAAAGNVGWNGSLVRPYFMKYENMKVEGLSDSPDFSTGGYLDIERPGWRTPLAEAYLKAGALLGYPTGDREGLTSRGFSYVLSTTRRGSRLSASKAFLRPIRDRPNIFVSKKSRVTKVLIDPETKAAYGVEFVKNKKKYRVRAKKEVILSAGTINSAQLLMLSGIGPSKHLKEMGIDVIRNAKVGQNLQDHVSMMGLAFLINSSLSIVEERYRSPAYALEYLLFGRGPYTLPGGAEAIAFVDTRLNKGRPMPDMELVFGPGALTGDSGGSIRQSFHINRTFFDETYGPFMGREAFGIVPVLLKPKSKGYLKLRSKNPFHWPLLYPNYYSHPEDMERMVDGIKKAVEIGESGPFKVWGSRALRRPVVGCQHLTWGSDKYWKCVCRYITTNLHHQVGTCKMGPDWDKDAVVDPRLRVRGVANLRIVDASIMPTIPAGHTNAVVFMIGEKASDMIKEDWNYTATLSST